MVTLQPAVATSILLSPQIQRRRRDSNVLPAIIQGRSSFGNGVAVDTLSFEIWKNQQCYKVVYARGPVHGPLYHVSRSKRENICSDTFRKKRSLSTSASGVAASSSSIEPRPRGPRRVRGRRSRRSLHRRRRTTRTTTRRVCVTTRSEEEDDADDDADDEDASRASHY